MLAELACPFPSAISPYADDVQGGTIRWLQQMGLITGREATRRAAAGRFGRLAARTHPHASREMLQIIADWYAWLFFRDDRCDEGVIGTNPSRLHHENSDLLAIMAGNCRPEQDEPLDMAFSDLCHRLRLTSHGTMWWRRFVRRCQEYFDATVWEAENRVRGLPPDLETYLRMRPLTSGVSIDIEFIGLTESTSLSSEIRNRSAIRQLIQASNNVVCWANDILSLEKEVRHGDVHNLVVAIEHEYQLSRSVAQRRAVEMHNAEVAEFCRLAHCLPTVPPGVEAKLIPFIAILGGRMRGNLDWSQETGRYGSHTVITEERVYFAPGQPKSTRHRWQWDDPTVCIS